MIQDFLVSRETDIANVCSDLYAVEPAWNQLPGDGKLQH